MIIYTVYRGLFLDSDSQPIGSFLTHQQASELVDHNRDEDKAHNVSEPCWYEVVETKIYLSVKDYLEEHS